MTPNQHPITFHLPLMLVLMALFSIVCQHSVQAEIVSDLNQITLEVADQSQGARNRAIGQGFKQVLIRYSGAAPERVAERLKAIDFRASHYLQRYYYAQSAKESNANDRPIREAGTQSLVLIFDELAIKNFLATLGLPQWDENRPRLLVWLVVGDKYRREFLNTEYASVINRLLQSNQGILFNDLNAEIDQELNTSDMEAGSGSTITNNSAYLRWVGTEDDLLEQLGDLADLRGLPLLLPLYDLNDQLALDSADVWGRFVQPIKQASERYQADAILVGRLELKPDTGWMLDWMLMDNVGSEVWQDQDQQLGPSMLAGLQTAIERLASRYSVTQSDTVADMTLIAVNNVHSVAAMAQLQDYLKQQPAIGQFFIRSVTQDRVILSVDFVGGESAFLQSVRLSDQIITLDLAEAGLIPFGSERPSLFFQWQD